MTIDITPQLAEGRKRIQGYGGGGFRIDGERMEGSLMVFPSHVAPWPVAAFAELSRASFDPVIEERPRVEILVVGCGDRLMLPTADLRAILREAGIAADFMDTGAACRTFNVLLSEERRAAAALIAVG